MAKAVVVRDKDGLFAGVRFWCPGCKYYGGSLMEHTLPVTYREYPGEPESPLVAGKDHWSFNGDFDHPVFGPSLNMSWGSGQPEVVSHRCHTFIGCNGAQPGQIVFLGDCTHELRGQVVDLPDVPVPKPWEDPDRLTAYGW